MTWRIHSPSCLALPALLLSLGCGDDAPAPNPEAAGMSSTASGAGSGGSSSGTLTSSGAGQTLGGGDQGKLFGPEGTVPLMPEGTPTGGTGGGGSAAATPVGDGNVATMTMRGPMGGTAIFSQTGVDVSIVVQLENCPDGNHHFRIHDGYACDNPATQGVLWGARGSDIGDPNGIVCSGGKGSLTYTRQGDEPTKNWTVADHNLETDVTAHVVMVIDAANPGSNASCGNFF